MRLSVIIACGGNGSRTGFKENKVLCPLLGSTPLNMCVQAFSSFDEIIIAARKSDFKKINSLVNGKNIILTEGGQTRSETVKNALEKVSGEIVLIHDGARPFVSKKIIEACVESVIKYRSGITSIPVTDTIAVCENEKFTSLPERKTLYAVQTPQGFYTEDIIKAYRNAQNEHTDDSGVYMETFGSVKAVLGSPENKKLTFKEDFEMYCDIYSGIGWDAHRFAQNRKLVLGGVVIPYEKGLDGHSDADVLVHAIMDALLSASGNRDIGYHFKDTDDKYKDISSLILLSEVKKMLEKQNYAVKNLSAVIVAQSPKLSDYINKMRENIAKTLNISINCVGINATTSEKMGFEGRGEGISAQATVLIYKK